MALKGTMFKAMTKKGSRHTGLNWLRSVEDWGD